MTATAGLLLALAAMTAIGNWVAVHQERKPLEYVCKPLTMLLLIGATVALDVDTGAGAVRTWFVIALVLCLIGDVLLMVPSDLFVFGLGAFLLGHLAYIVGLHVEGIDAARLVVGAGLVLVVLAVLGTVILRHLRAGPDRQLAGPVLAYMAVISAMVASAIGTGQVVAVVGAGSFYVSDALIAWNRFVRALPGANVAIMITYHLAQAGLILSLA